MDHPRHPIADGGGSGQPLDCLGSQGSLFTVALVQIVHHHADFRLHSSWLSNKTRLLIGQMPGATPLAATPPDHMLGIHNAAGDPSDTPEHSQLASTGGSEMSPLISRWTIKVVIPLEAARSALAQPRTGRPQSHSRT